jgi:hypothetical protein
MLNCFYLIICSCCHVELLVSAYIYTRVCEAKAYIFTKKWNKISLKGERLYIYKRTRGIILLVLMCHINEICQEFWLNLTAKIILLFWLTLWTCELFFTLPEAMWTDFTHSHTTYIYIYIYIYIMQGSCLRVCALEVQFFWVSTGVTSR